MTNKKDCALRRLQLCELEILKYFVDFCEKNNLRYYISGGTFLGAVRHKGFIPWDDDVDIAMPRKDYERFLNLADKITKYKVKNFRFSDDYILLPTRLTDSSIKVVSRATTKEQVWDAWIDIFPLDGLPNNYFLRQLYKARLSKRLLTLKLSCFDDVVNVKKKKGTVLKRLAVSIGKHVKFNKLLNTRKQLAKLDTMLKKQSKRPSRYYMNFYGAYKFDSILDKKEYYGSGAYYEFEGLKLFGPANYDKYLSHIYGNYMEIPKKSDQNVHDSEIVEG